MPDVTGVTYSLAARVTEFTIPPVSDGLVLGKDSPIGYSAISRALQLLVANHFHTIAVDDEVISHIIVRRNLLNRIPQQKLVSFVQTKVKPLMSSEEILHLTIEAEVKIEDNET